MSHNEQEEKVQVGFWVYLMSDVVLFASLFATFAVLREPMGDLFSVPFILLETIILLTSSFTAGLALLASSRLLKTLALGMTLVLGVSFLVLEVTEFIHFFVEGHSPQMSASLSAFFTLVGTHGAHVAAGCVWLVASLVYLWTYGISAVGTRRLTCFVLFWHFLDVVWIFIFTFVYLWGML